MKRTRHSPEQIVVKLREAVDSLECDEAIEQQVLAALLELEKEGRVVREHDLWKTTQPTRHTKPA